MHDYAVLETPPLARHGPAARYEDVGIAVWRCYSFLFDKPLLQVICIKTARKGDGFELEVFWFAGLVTFMMPFV